jgi:4-aminobutyrate aminotransferase-like enzyme
MNTLSMQQRRERLFGPANPLFYEEPLHLVRGEGVWLFDADGGRFLDCYNNVPCVGHAHPRYVEAVCEQTRLLNTHTRYLHETILEYAERLLGKFDGSLDRLALACTGSEANDLAMRMARHHTGAEGFICTDATYHGNTTAVSQFSAIYEPVGGPSPNVRRVPHPDAYRAPDGVAPEQLADHYVEQVERAIRSLAESGDGLAAMIVCPIFANEGLPDTPAGYLQRVYALVCEAGGLLIADEVQAGFGRTGSWWGHEPSSIVPDIVTLGKPMAGGYPVAGLVTRGEILDAYRLREMYFNTFGGNPVACAAALAVLEILEREDLIGNATRVGQVIERGLEELQGQHECIGDVRGSGLFLGLDVVSDRNRRTPDEQTAAQIVNDVRRRGVLISKAGQHNNVLKIRPPLCFSESNASMLLEVLDASLASVASGA